MIFADGFAVILSAVALPVLQKIESNFEAILYITILFSEVPKAALNTVESAMIVMSLRPSKERRILQVFFISNVFLTLYSMIFLSAPLKHCLVFLLSILRPKEVIFCERKQDLESLKICARAVQVAYIRTDRRTPPYGQSRVNQIFSARWARAGAPLSTYEANTGKSNAIF